MTAVLDILQPLLEETVTQMGYEFVGVEVVEHAGMLIRVYVDAEGGITVNHIQKISRQLSGVLDVEDVMHHRYTLEVSSPGVDRILFTLAHYQKYLGRCIKVHTKYPVNEQSNYTGVLREANAEQIKLSINEQDIILDMNAIKIARLVPEFT